MDDIDLLGEINMTRDQIRDPNNFCRLIYLMII